MANDLYEILGVSRTATNEEINKAYRKLARKLHPDRNPGDKQAENRFKEVQAAYEILNDPQKRAQYDRFGKEGPPHAGSYGGAGGFPGGFSGNFGGAEVDPMFAQKIFEHFFGGSVNTDSFRTSFGGGTTSAGRGNRGSRTRRNPSESYPESVEVEAEIPFTTAALGGTITLLVENQEIEVKVPAGIGDGKKLRLSGQAPGNGDITVKIKILPHPYFKREGNDLLLDVPLSFPEAALGTTIEVPTISGKKLEVKVPPGTSAGMRLRLPKFGINNGDQFLVFQIILPRGKPDDSTRQLIESYAKQNPIDARKNIPWI